MSAETLQRSVENAHTGIEGKNGHRPSLPLSGDVPFITTDGVGLERADVIFGPAIPEGLANGRSANGHEVVVGDLNEHYAPYAARIAEIQQVREDAANPRVSENGHDNGHMPSTIDLAEHYAPYRARIEEIEQERERRARSMNTVGTQSARRKSGMRRSIRDRLR